MQANMSESQLSNNQASSLVYISCLQNHKSAGSIPWTGKYLGKYLKCSSITDFWKYQFAIILEKKMRKKVLLAFVCQCLLLFDNI